MCYQQNRTGRAVYIGTQKGIDDIPDFDLYNVDCPGHPLHKSTIDREQAEAEGFVLEHRTVRDRFEEAKNILEMALTKAIEAVEIAKEELSRPLTKEELYERDHKELDQ